MSIGVTNARISSVTTSQPRKFASGAPCQRQREFRRHPEPEMIHARRERFEREIKQHRQRRRDANEPEAVALIFRHGRRMSRATPREFKMAEDPEQRQRPRQGVEQFRPALGPGVNWPNGNAGFQSEPFRRAAGDPDETPPPGVLQRQMPRSARRWCSRPPAKAARRPATGLPADWRRSKA